MDCNNKDKAQFNQAVEKLKDQELQYQRLVDLSPEAIAVHTKGKIVYINNTAARLIGASSPGDLMGRSIMDFVHPDYVDLVKKRVEYIYKMKKPTDLLEEKLICLTGEIIDVEVISMPFMFEGKESIQLVIRDITERKKLNDRSAFLEKISNTLFTSFDNEITLKKVAKLIVPALADYCRIVIVDAQNHVKAIEVNHKDRSMVKLAKQLHTEYKDRPSVTHGVDKLLQTGKPEIIPHVDASMIKTVQDNRKLVKIIKDIGLKSYMGVPLIARNKVIGAITFSSVQSNRYYTKADLAFAEEVGKRIAIALDNSRLYREAETEIAERKATEDQLKTHQERLQMIQTAVNLGSFEYDIVNNKLYWSPELKVLYGLPPDQEIKKIEQWNKLILPEDRKLISIEAENQQKNSDITEVEYRIVWPDKSIHWIYSKSRIFKNHAGLPVRSVGINIDITQRKNMELNFGFLAEASKVLSSSLDYQTTLNAVARLAVPTIADWCGVDIVNLDGSVEQVAVVHKDPKKVKWAKELRKRQPVDMNAEGGLQTALKTGKAQIYPHITEEMIRASTKTKKEYTLIKSLGLTSVMIVPLFTQGTPIGAISFITTDNKRHYTKTDLSMAEELAARASLAIENARLYKGSQDAISLRDDFISVASHELKTPVTSVKIFTQVLQHHSQQIGDAKAVNHLQKMNRQLDKLTELIYNLLNISKIQAGRMEYKLQLFDFDKMIKEVAEVHQHTASHHKLMVKGHTGQMVYGDEDRLGQVLSNLVSNAIKYSPSADRVEIKLSKKQNNIIVAVRDFGIGMAKEHLTKIFERFYRVYDTTDKTFPGLGIGLYISSEIIKRHNGRLWVESHAGKGSTFYFSLPVKKS